MNELYSQLLDLVNNSDKTDFSYKDEVSLTGSTLRIFSSTSSDWTLPSALECNGITFKIDANEQPIELICRPIEKIFSLTELTATQNIDLDKIKYWTEKADGTLISTYQEGGVLFTKSKKSIFSDQAIDAKQLFEAQSNNDLKTVCLDLAIQGYTCNFEYVSEKNRVVLLYPEAELILLNVRNNLTGEYLEYNELKNHAVLRNYLVKAYKIENFDQDSIEEFKNQYDLQGGVFVLEDGTKFKLTTYWYDSLFSAKSSISDPKALFECVVSGSSDDLKGLFSTQDKLDKINAFEQTFLDYLNSAIQNITNFLTNNRDLDRKSFVVKAQIEFNSTPELFNPLMSLYGVELDIDTLISSINMVFFKYCEKYIPKQYTTT